MSGAKIIKGLEDALAGNMSAVTIEGQRWVRVPDGTDKFEGDKADVTALVLYAQAMERRELDLRDQLADAEATLLKLNSGEELQSLMKLNNELRKQLVNALEYVEADLRERFSVSGQNLRDQIRIALSDDQSKT